MQNNNPQLSANTPKYPGTHFILTVFGGAKYELTQEDAEKLAALLTGGDLPEYIRITDKFGNIRFVKISTINELTMGARLYA